jgi:transposase-like protein/rubredoxin
MFKVLSQFTKNLLIRLSLLTLLKITSQDLSITNSTKAIPKQTPNNIILQEVDILPLTSKPTNDYRKILEEKKKLGITIQPINHRIPIPDDLHCPQCNAPKDYLYNYGYPKDKNIDLYHKIQCKICGYQGSPYAPKHSPKFFCPYCGKPLEKIRQRKNFTVWKCCNKRCPFRNNKQAKLQAVKEHRNPSKISYIYREFNIDLSQLQLSLPTKPKIDYAKIRFSHTAVALAITFHINMGLSTREAAFWLNALYELKISHTTIEDWTQSIAYLLTPLFLSFESSSEILVGDETYISICGKWGYLWASYDPNEAKILICHISTSRSTQNAATLLYSTLLRAKNLNTYVVDGYPAYPLAISLLSAHQLKLPQLKIVKGLKSCGDESDTYRIYKNLIERFFRTFKQRYRRTHGFNSLNGAVAFTTLFTIYYNYFRPHQRINKIPVEIQTKTSLITEKWSKLINLAISKSL